MEAALRLESTEPNLVAIEARRDPDAEQSRLARVIPLEVSPWRTEGVLLSTRSHPERRDTEQSVVRT